MQLLNYCFFYFKVIIYIFNKIIMKIITNISKHCLKNVIINYNIYIVDTFIIAASLNYYKKIINLKM